MRIGSTFVLFLFQTYGGCMSPLLSNTLSSSVFSLQNLSSLLGVSLYFAQSKHVPLTHVRCAGPRIRFSFAFSSPMVSRTTPSHFARLCFPSWCVEGAIGLERRLKSFEVMGPSGQCIQQHTTLFCVDFVHHCDVSASAQSPITQQGHCGG
jgi:hypothetical protein